LVNGDIWEQTNQLIAENEVFVGSPLGDKIEAPKFSGIRIIRILDRGIYPVVGHSEYLSHNVTILLAFNSLYPQLTDSQKQPFIDRLAEFVTSTFGGISFKLPSNSTRSISYEKALAAALNQPSFFGHNLIALAWIIRSQPCLNEANGSAIAILKPQTRFCLMLLKLISMTYKLKFLPAAQKSGVNSRTLVMCY
jgi:hypothetical protein